MSKQRPIERCIATASYHMSLSDKHTQADRDNVQQAYAELAELRRRLAACEAFVAATVAFVNALDGGCDDCHDAADRLADAHAALDWRPVEDEQA